MKTEKILSGLLGRISPFAAVWSSRLPSTATSVQTAGAFKRGEDEDGDIVVCADDVDGNGGDDY